jgi:NarL family two-component system response regulator LiaR
MDLVMPHTDGITAINLLRQQNHHIQIIALTSFTDQKLIDSALKAGAMSYLLKDISATRLADEIRNVYKAGQNDDLSNKKQLSQRECQVLSLLADGLTNEQIAQQLGISVSTAKHHVSKILEKLDVSSRTEAGILAIRNY